MIGVRDVVTVARFCIRPFAMAVFAICYYAVERAEQYTTLHAGLLLHP